MVSELFLVYDCYATWLLIVSSEGLSSALSLSKTLIRPLRAVVHSSRFQDLQANPLTSMREVQRARNITQTQQRAPY